MPVIWCSPGQSRQELGPVVRQVGEPGAASSSSGDSPHAGGAEESRGGEAGIPHPSRRQVPCRHQWDPGSAGAQRREEVIQILSGKWMKSVPGRPSTSPADRCVYHSDGDASAGGAEPRPCKGESEFPIGAGARFSVHHDQSHLYFRHYVKDPRQLGDRTLAKT